MKDNHLLRLFFDDRTGIFSLKSQAVWLEGCHSDRCFHDRLDIQLKRPPHEFDGKNKRLEEGDKFDAKEFPRRF